MGFLKNVVFFPLDRHDNKVCNICGHSKVEGVTHIHDPEVKRYQDWFYNQHGRLPTWEDSLADCPADIKESWKIKLEEWGLLKNDSPAIEKAAY